MDSLKATILLSVGSVGMVLFMVGLSLSQGQYDNTKNETQIRAGKGEKNSNAQDTKVLNDPNPLALKWYLLCLGFAIFGLCWYGKYKGLLEKYRLSIIGFSACFLSLAPIQLDATIKFIKTSEWLSRQKLLNGNAHHAAKLFGGIQMTGIILATLSLFVLIFIIGSEFESWFGLGPSTEPARNKTNSGNNGVAANNGGYW
jgi:hypothetical protein